MPPPRHQAPPLALAKYITDKEIRPDELVPIVANVDVPVVRTPFQGTRPFVPHPGAPQMMVTADPDGRLRRDPHFLPPNQGIRQPTFLERLVDPDNWTRTFGIQNNPGPDPRTAPRSVRVPRTQRR